MSKGKLKLNKKQKSSFEEMYKIRILCLEGRCIKERLQGIIILLNHSLGLQKMLLFITLNSASDINLRYKNSKMVYFYTTNI